MDNARETTRDTRHENPLMKQRMGIHPWDCAWLMTRSKSKLATNGSAHYREWLTGPACKNKPCTVKTMIRDKAR